MTVMPRIRAWPSPSCFPRDSNRRDRTFPASSGSAAGRPPTVAPAARGSRLPRQLRPHRRRTAARPAGRRHRARAGRRLGVAAAGVAAGRAHRVDRRSVLDRGAVRAADCTRPSATLDYVTVTVFGVIAGAAATRLMTNPFVYGEIVPVAAVRRPRGRARPPRPRPLCRAEGLPDLAAPLRQVVARPAGAAQRRPKRRPHGRGPGQQLQLVRGFSRGLRPCAGVGRNHTGSGPLVAERDARRRPARGAHRAGRGRAQRRCRSPFPRSGPIATSRSSPTRSLRCRAGSPTPGAGGWRSRSTNFRASRRSTAAASSTHCAPPCSSSGRSATSSPDPNRH